MQTPTPSWAELLVQVARVLGFFLAVVAPALWFCVRRLPQLSLVGRIALGAATGFGLFILAAWYGGLWAFPLVGMLWLIECAAAAWWGRRRSGTATEANRDSPSAGDPSPQLILILTLLPLAIGAAFLLHSFTYSHLPRGTDASFHCLVAQRQLDAGHATSDLRPLEDIDLNYPIGCHLWLALTARCTGLDVHAVFRHSFIVALAIAGLCVAAWAERLFPSPWAAPAAAFAFVFGSYQASMFPYFWGGLPSIQAMGLLLAASYGICCVAGPLGIALGAILLAACAMTHHHTLVAAIAGTTAAAVISSGTRWGPRSLIRRLATAWPCALLLAGAYTIPLVARASRVRETGIGGYGEDFHWPWEQLWAFGTALLLLAGLGIASAIARRVTEPHDVRQWRRFLLALAASWGIVFCLLDYGGRVLTRRWWGAEATPFTPSRFLFDAQFALAIFAGGGLLRLGERLRRPAAISSLLVLVAGVASYELHRRSEVVVADHLLPMSRWIRTNLPEDALVTGPANHWLTYLCHRETTSTFVPVSEPSTSPRRDIKNQLATDPDSATWAEWSERLGKPIYVISVVWDRSWPDPPLHSTGQVAVYRAHR